LLRDVDPPWETTLSARLKIARRTDLGRRSDARKKVRYSMDTTAAMTTAKIFA